MPELKVKSVIGASAIAALGIVLCVGTSFIFATRIGISIPLFIISALLIYLIFNMIFYSKTKAFQLLVLSMTSVAFLGVIFVPSYLISSLIFPNNVLVNQNFDISANPVFFATSVIFGILSTIILLKLEIVQKTESVKTIHNFTENNSVIEKPVLEEFTEAQEIIEESIPLNVDKPDLVPVNYSESPSYQTPVSDKIYENEKQKPEFNQCNDQQIFENVIEPLPEIKLEENTSENNNLMQTSSNKYDESIFDIDDIPDDIRLSDTQKLNKPESKGIISSIGKLLINHRDIENIIETNELMQQIGCSSDDVDIVTMTSGIKIYEKFNKVMVEYTQVKDLTLSNEAGFTIASIIQDSRRSETVGAIASGAYLVLKNYLSRLEISNLQKVFFESEDIIYSLFKTDNFVLFFISDKSFEPISYSLVKDVLDQNNISNQDLSVIKNIKGVVESAITDREGLLIGSINSENPRKLASLSSAIFENLKVFIMNIQPSKLYKITVFTSDKVLTIRKYNDKIAGLLTLPDGPVKLSDQILEIEGLMK